MKIFSKVTATDLPHASLMTPRIGQNDFCDCFSIASNIPPRTAAEIIVTFPAWGDFLLKIRRVVTTPFGLSNDGPEADDKIGPFPVEIETKDELIAGFDDRHLEFRVSVMQKDERLFLATWVHPHNVFGWIYLWSIYPFHVLIARDALVRAAEQG